MNWTKTHQRWLALICVAYFLIGLVYAWATPPLDASDEFKHYPVVQYIQTTGQLPVLDPADPGLWSNEAAQPPLYYALMALATLPFDTSDLEQLHQVNTHFFVGNPHQIRNKNIILHQPALENTATSGTVQAIYVIRLLSLTLGLGTIWLTAVLGRKFLPATPALIAAGFTAFNPMFIFLSASVNNDTLAALLGATGLVLLVQFWRDPPDPRRQWWRYALLGLVCGLGLLTKVSLAALLLLAGILLAIRAWQSKRWSLLFGGGLLTFTIAMLLWVPWLARNFALYGDITALNVFIAVQGTRPDPSLFGVDWLGEFGTFYRNYWGQFGGVNIPAPEWFYTIANALLGLGLLGWLARVGLDVSKQDDQALASWGHRFTSSGGWLLVALPFILFLLLVRWTIVYYSFQGRLMFPALAGINVMWAGGLWQWGYLLRRWLTPRAHTAVLASTVTFFGLMAFLMPIFIIQPNYEFPEPLTAVPSEHQFGPIRFQASDGHTLTLVGVATKPTLPTTTAGNPQGVDITLYWTMDEPTDKNYVTSVHVLGRGLNSVGQSDRYPGWGMWPTSRWQAGEIYKDEYRVQVQPEALAPSRLQFSVGVLEPFPETKTPIKAANTAVMPALAPNGEAIPLVIVGQARLAATSAPPSPTHPLPAPLEDGITFLGYDQPEQVTAGGTVDITLHWHATDTPSQDYTVFFQLLDTNNTYIAGADSPPLNGDYSTSLWQPSDTITETRQLTLPADLPPGNYFIATGLYDPATGARLPLVGGRGTDTITWRFTVGE